MRVRNLIVDGNWKFWVGIIVTLGPITIAYAAAQGAMKVRVDAIQQESVEFRSSLGTLSQRIFDEKLTNEKQTVILDGIMRKLKIK